VQETDANLALKMALEDAERIKNKQGILSRGGHTEQRLQAGITRIEGIHEDRPSYAQVPGKKEGSRR
jgi:hypothetical protein